MLGSEFSLITRKTAIASNACATFKIKYGLSVGETVLGYLLNQPFSVLALIGPKSLADPKDST